MAELIKGLGSGGLVADLPAVIAPMNVFTDVLNVRCDNESVQTITGEKINFTNALAPDFGIHWRRPDQSYNIFAKNGLIQRVDAAGNVSTMFTSGGAEYTNSVWHGSAFNGGFAIVVNNGAATPLYALFNDPVAGSTFQPLPNWNYLAGLTVTAKLIRPLNYALVAANFTLVQSGVTTYAPGTIRVSTQAATGSIPQVWQPGLTTDTADEFELSSTSPILEMAELRGNMYVYSSDSINVVSIGTTTRVQPYAKGYGVLNTNCVAEFDGQHFVVDRNDIYVHGGAGSITSICNFRVRDFFFNQLNQAAISKVHVVKDPRNDEIWVCFPSGTSTSCNKALIYQYRNNTFTVRSLPSTLYSFAGPQNDSSAFQYGIERVYMTTGTTRVFITDDNYLMWNGTALAAYTSYVERKKFNAGDVALTTIVSAIYPIFDKTPPAASITISMQGQHNYTKDVDLSIDSPTLKDTFTFLPDDNKGQGYKIDPRVQGRLLNYRISSTSNWRLAALGFEAIPAGRR